MRLGLFVIMVTMLAGCASPRYYTWSSERGKQCFYTCESSMYQCSAYCGPSWTCNNSCDNAAVACRMACPDLAETTPPQVAQK